MKRILIIIQIIVFGLSIAYSSTSVKDRYNKKREVVVFNDGTIMYLDFNSKDKSLSVLNSDNTLWNKYYLNIPKSYKVKEIKLIRSVSSQKETNVKILYSVYSVGMKPISDFEDRYNDQVYTVHVLDFSGVDLLTVSGVDNYKILSENGSKKLFVNRTERKVFKVRRYSEVYDLNL